VRLQRGFETRWPPAVPRLESVGHRRPHRFPVAAAPAEGNRGDTAAAGGRCSIRSGPRLLHGRLRTLRPAVANISTASGREPCSRFWHDSRTRFGPTNPSLPAAALRAVRMQPLKRCLQRALPEACLRQKPAASPPRRAPSVRRRRQCPSLRSVDAARAFRLTKCRRMAIAGPLCARRSAAARCAAVLPAQLHMRWAARSGPQPRSASIRSCVSTRSAGGRRCSAPVRRFILQPFLNGSARRTR
jgi:hypothetical protein